MKHWLRSCSSTTGPVPFLTMEKMPISWRGVRRPNRSSRKPVRLWEARLNNFQPKRYPWHPTFGSPNGANVPVRRERITRSYRPGWQSKACLIPRHLDVSYNRASNLKRKPRNWISWNKRKNDLKAACETRWGRVFDLRKAITQARIDFVTGTLRANDFVKMAVVPFGFDARVIERDLRNLLDVLDERFESDILHLENGVPVSGLAFELAQADDGESKLAQIKERILGIDNSLGGHFRNYLQAQAGKTRICGPCAMLVSGRRSPN